MKDLPLGLLGSIVGPVTGGTGGGPVTALGGTSSGTGVPVGSTLLGTSEASGRGITPVATGRVLEARLDGGGALLVDTGELLLLDLVLGLGLGVAVCSEGLVGEQWLVAGRG